ncbi:MAG: SIS domain-containing protein [Desulfobacterales bacterium]|nr:SIS domain-containing protein [Desulfobacterales bacterium]
MDNKISPDQWIGELGRKLAAVRCRVQDQATSFSAAASACDALFLQVRESRSRVWWIGNGGSAALCSHLAQDMMNKMGLRSQFCGDAALMTCMANDFGYDQVYKRPLECLGDEGDILVAVSSSGASENILQGVRTARKKGMNLITLSGFDGENPLWCESSRIAFHVPSRWYGIVELAHEAILHSIIECHYLNRKGGGDG